MSSGHAKRVVPQRCRRTVRDIRPPSRTALVPDERRTQSPRLLRRATATMQRQTLQHMRLQVFRAVTEVPRACLLLCVVGELPPSDAHDNSCGAGKLQRSRED